MYEHCYEKRGDEIKIENVPQRKIINDASFRSSRVAKFLIKS